MNRCWLIIDSKRVASSGLSNPSTRLAIGHGHGTRVDECRLLFLSQSSHHTRFPVCQWRPFDVTPVEDVDIEVRVHAECEGHELQYQGFSWDCTNDDMDFQSLGEAEIRTPAGCLTKQDVNGAG